MSSQTETGKAAVITVVLTGFGSDYATDSTVTMQNAGIGYAPGDSLTVLGSLIGGNGTNNLTLTVLTTSNRGAIITFSVSGTASLTASTFTDISLPFPSSGLGYRSSIQYTRDSSDITKQIKERIMYNEKKANSPVKTGKRSLIVGGRPQVNPAGVNHLPAGNAELLWQPQGNQFRLSYLFGKVQCGECDGGAFNSSGPPTDS
jgi:hypothetical protein